MLYRGGDSIVTVLYIVRLPCSTCSIEVVTVIYCVEYCKVTRFYMLYRGGDSVVTVLSIVRLPGSTCPIEVVAVLLLCCILHGYQVLHAL